MKSFAIAAFMIAATLIGLAQAEPVRVTIARGRCVASVQAVRTAPYDGGPWAEIPASCLNDSPHATAKDFRIRAWKEADRTRVVVFAVMEDANAAAKEREKQIATFVISPGQSINVTETTTYNAEPVTLCAK